MIKLSNKYSPLFVTNKEIDTYIVTGGRYSSKSLCLFIGSR